jgi:hypothetical protein
MKRRIPRMLLALAIGLTVFAGGIWVLTKTLEDRERLYRGKPLNYWIDQSNSKEAAVSNQATAVIAGEILPQLTQLMFHDTNDSKLKLSLVEKLNALPGVVIFCQPAEVRRGQAVVNIGLIGPAAHPAVPDLRGVLKGHDESLHGQAINSLGKIHADPDTIVPLLIGYLDSPLNAEAAEALGAYGDLARTAVPKLVPLLKIPDKDLHRAVSDALKEIDPKAAFEAGVK